MADDHKEQLTADVKPYNSNTESYSVCHWFAGHSCFIVITVNN